MSFVPRESPRIPGVIFCTKNRINQGRRHYTDSLVGKVDSSKQVVPTKYLVKTDKHGISCNFCGNRVTTLKIVGRDLVIARENYQGPSVYIVVNQGIS